MLTPETSHALNGMLRAFQMSADVRDKALALYVKSDVRFLDLVANADDMKGNHCFHSCVYAEVCLCLVYLTFLPGGKWSS